MTSHPFGGAINGYHLGNTLLMCILVCIRWIFCVLSHFHIPYILWEIVNLDFFSLALCMFHFKCVISFSLQRYVVSTDRSGDIHVTVQVSFMRFLFETQPGQIIFTLWHRDECMAYNRTEWNGMKSETQTQPLAYKYERSDF